MNIRQNLISFFAPHPNADGRDYVPPAPCLRSAYCSAHTAAYLTCTESDRSTASRTPGTGRGLMESSLFQIKEGSV